MIAQQLSSRGAFTQHLSPFSRRLHLSFRGVCTTSLSVLVVICNSHRARPPPSRARGSDRSPVDGEALALYAEADQSESTATGANVCGPRLAARLARAIHNRATVRSARGDAAGAESGYLEVSLSAASHVAFGVSSVRNENRHSRVRLLRGVWWVAQHARRWPPPFATRAVTRAFLSWVTSRLS